MVLGVGGFPRACLALLWPWWGRCILTVTAVRHGEDPFLSGWHDGHRKCSVFRTDATSRNRRSDTTFRRWIDVAGGACLAWRVIKRLRRTTFHRMSNRSWHMVSPTGVQSGSSFPRQWGARARIVFGGCLAPAQCRRQLIWRGRVGGRVWVQDASRKRLRAVVKHPGAEKR